MTITSTLPQIAQECSCSMLVVALIRRYVRRRSITLGPPAHERTALRPSSMTPWAPAMPSLAYLAEFTRVLAPAICSRFHTRLAHVMYTSHATPIPHARQVMSYTFPAAYQNTLNASPPQHS